MIDRAINLVVLAGPTGVGKTDLSIELAKTFNGEVVSADSMQVYRNLDIGTGKILPHEMQGVPHYLIDIQDPDQTYDAARFKEAGQEAIRKIHRSGHLPILVGGTGLYLEGLLYDLEFGGKNSTDSLVQQKLKAELEESGIEALWQRLNQLDPIAADKISLQNPRRILRALEVIETTGQRFSDQMSHQEKQSRFREYLFVLNRPRQQLYDRINQRVLQMIDQGLEDEVRSLYQRNMDPNLPAMKGIGYKEWRPYFEGKVSLQTVIEQIQQNSRRYAKRQLTWYRNRMKNVHWLDVSQPDYIDNAIRQVAQFIEEG
ncbi:tRNA (adenosine(37)-N6)-dimethylallyltransferase MiaA [Facklamia hominis]|uniref:tRNA (adenosine(37)-N6)-dimethylallyltransferase MiaA n=1 Tax=Facklamia hominis TaxID=178214 RepID=UPI000C7D8A29|nr:tRNA (adenosine(37)-N6)-dimethylallyltransferase MiaA [Facklamia hominis]PKY92626.1 tRNA (adenosine(37)-N6)-dimethylallyltransferase MiaA [Facklamia hominis]RYC97583.1 tRNA (adenosine(37)-N6)-dimethylallyltransferase MiaA [Facklamia hominis]WPJ90183.1 tRNA (adenosine(37)-N6)-dimethylallyltransferase MiaA [Facklamia hominis]